MNTMQRTISEIASLNLYAVTRKQGFTRETQHVLANTMSAATEAISKANKYWTVIHSELLASGISVVLPDMEIVPARTMR